MDLRQLEYFRMVCRLNNMTRAAERLHVAQPAISVAIQKLEEELGVLLFERSQKQFTLTAEGRVFLERAEELLNKAQDAILEMHEYRELRKGSLKLGVPPMIGSFLFPHIFAGFKQLYPSIQLKVIEEGSLAVRKLLEQDEVDLGIVIVSDPSPLLSIQPIAGGEILLCVSPDHHLSELETIGFENLRDEPFILLKEDTYHRQIIVSECKQHGFEPNVLLSSSQIETIRGLVSKGVGISFLLDVIARKDGQIHCLHLADPIHITIGLAWKKDRYLSKAAQSFVDFMKTLA
ncbi:LysR family transcriptional regulator [Anaerosporomusa subterranea]|uniref:LysR family transcriptional regulator n=1 Tax=Anaerosporomusa subterranea TaxID=1794912 RepID=A0A154BMB3_ANASB|nr:LysR family transcriptional regulator [Anaerosporomusa subterranea]KYZ75119.1 LysR family transcriptional regulator [Anaerosporomusa subterranea]